MSEKIKDGPFLNRIQNDDNKFISGYSSYESGFLKNGKLHGEYCRYIVGMEENSFPPENQFNKDDYFLIEKTEYKNGKKNGKSQLFNLHSDEIHLETNYKNDVKHGNDIEFYLENHLWVGEQKVYDHGELVKTIIRESKIENCEEYSILFELITTFDKNGNKIDFKRTEVDSKPNRNPL